MTPTQDLALGGLVIVVIALVMVGVRMRSRGAASRHAASLTALFSTTSFNSADQPLGVTNERLAELDLFPRGTGNSAPYARDVIERTVTIRAAGSDVEIRQAVFTWRCYGRDDYGDVEADFVATAVMLPMTSPWISLGPRRRLVRARGKGNHITGDMAFDDAFEVELRGGDPRTVNAVLGRSVRSLLVERFPKHDLEFHGDRVWLLGKPTVVNKALHKKHRYYEGLADDLVQILAAVSTEGWRALSVRNK